MRTLKAFADLVRTTSFGVRSSKDGQDFPTELQRSLTKFMFARMERLPSAIYDMKWCRAITATALNSVRPVFCQVPLWHVVCFSHVVGAMKYFGGRMAKIIEFYIPHRLRKVSKRFPRAERGKVLAFPLAVRKSA